MIGNNTLILCQSEMKRLIKLGIKEYFADEPEFEVVTVRADRTGQTDAFVIELKGTEE